MLPEFTCGKLMSKVTYTPASFICHVCTPGGLDSPFLSAYYGNNCFDSHDEQQTVHLTRYGDHLETIRFYVPGGKAGSKRRHLTVVIWKRMFQ